MHWSLSIGTEFLIGIAPNIIMYKPDFILIDKEVQHLETTSNIVSKFPDVDRSTIYDLDFIKKPSDFSLAKKMLLITQQKGQSFKPCQGITPNHLCCNYWIIDLVSNCPYDCSYCVLQYYLSNNPLLTLYANVEEIASNALEYTTAHKNKKFRIGTGELGDSLVIDDITGFSKILIESFANEENVSLELKTKSVNVDHLLDIDNKGNTVIAWSVNPQEIISTEEHGATSLEERFSAAEKVVKAGFRVAFHFDPIVFSEDLEKLYKRVTDQIIQRFDPAKISWISIGTLRFPTGMKDIVMKRFPNSRIFYDEFISDSGKTRYFRPIRERIYKKMLKNLEPLKKDVPIYLCMETKIVWQNVMSSVKPSNKGIEDYVCSKICSDSILPHVSANAVKNIRI